MGKMKNSVFNWSGGKDSALCLYHCLRNKDITIKILLTTVNKEFNRISMHGVRRELLLQQAQEIGIPLKEIFLPETTSLEIYNKVMQESLESLKNEEIKYSIFGDIFLEDLKKYREEKLGEVDLIGLFPLWKSPTKEIINEFLHLGFKTIVVCVNEKYLDKSFVGRIIDESFINDLPDNVDPCGENGEFHTFVFDGPIFKNKIEFETGEVVYKNYEPTEDKDDCYKKDSDINFDTGFWYMDLIPK